MNKKLFGSLAAVLLSIPAMPAMAEGLVALQGDVQVERTVVEDGVAKIFFTAPDKVVPGDKLVFTTSFENQTGEKVEQFVVTNPVPAAVMVAPGSAEELEVSVDGGASWGRIADLQVSDGSGGTRAASSSDITHIRWIIPVIAKGESGKLAYNAIVR